MNTTRASEFLRAHTARVAPLSRDLHIAYWKSCTTGEKKYLEETERLEAELLGVFADAEAFERVRGWLDAPDGLPPHDRRQLQLLKNEYTAHQKTPEEIAAILRLESRISELFTNFRGTFRGQPISNNEIEKILTESDDVAMRREAWEASKEIGGRAAPLVIEVVRKRNDYARRMGYRDHYAMSLALSEIDEDALWKVLDELGERSAQPFRAAKGALDAELKARFGCRTEELRPWHYSDMFFQRAPRVERVNLDGYLAASDPVQLALATYHRLGLDIRDLVEKSDLYARDGKDQSGFCLDVDREGDIRVLVNLEPNERWTGTLLHEYGHAVYDKHLERELPFVLRRPAHTITTEAIALLMGRMVQDEAWLREVLRVPEKDVAELRPHLRDYQRLSMLVFLRWGLVVTNFERRLYRDPDGDLNGWWWDLVERLQLVPRPEGRRQPDWAAKIHFGSAPVYYQNYILGELMASQLRSHIERETGKGLLDSPETGRYLVEKIFRPGAVKPWNDLLAEATREPLSPRPFLREFVEV